MKLDHIFTDKLIDEMIATIPGDWLFEIKDNETAIDFYNYYEDFALSLYIKDGVVIVSLWDLDDLTTFDNKLGERILDFEYGNKVITLLKNNHEKITSLKIFAPSHDVLLDRLEYQHNIMLSSRENQNQFTPIPEGYIGIGEYENIDL